MLKTTNDGATEETRQFIQDEYARFKSTGIPFKEAVYCLLDGTSLTVPYDPNAPCRCCGLAVGAASVGGTAICPSCDMGEPRSPRCWHRRLPLRPR